MTFEDNWGKEMFNLYNNELINNDESELWVNQVPGNSINTPEIELSQEEKEWGEELQKIYDEFL